MRTAGLTWSLFFLLLAAMELQAQTAYRLPPPEVVEIIDAPVEPAVSFSPDGKWLLLIERRTMPGIEDVARRMLQLGGIRIDPAANSGFQVDFDRGLLLRALDDPRTVRIPLPEDAKLSSASWSHHSNAFVYTLVTDAGTELWWVSLKSPTEPRRLTDRLSTVLSGYAWSPDGERILCCLVPENRRAEPAQPPRPLGPNIQESSGNTSPTRTYQDLLQNPHDEAMFEHYGRTQLAWIDQRGAVQLLRPEPAMFADVEISPDGKHLLVTTIQKPFSYLLPYSGFPQQIEVWDADGKLESAVADIPLADNIPIEGVRLGPRSVSWTSSDPATLHWFEALDGGDPRTKVDFRDRLVRFAAPFDGVPEELLKVQHRAGNLAYFADPNLCAVSDYDRDRRWIRTQLYDFSAIDAEPRTLVDRSIRDSYGDPGRLVSIPNAAGHSVVRQDGNWIYFAGMGATPEGNRPFLDRHDLASAERDRLWRCDSGMLESPVRIVDGSPLEKPTVITRLESPTQPPNYIWRDLRNDQEKRLTDFPDPTPQIRSIRKQLVKYQRADGVPLSATLYLPADYQEGTRLPLLIWAYPLEFNDPDTAGQVTTSPFQFTRMAGLSHLTLLTQGYAIMDNATMPVVGDPETMNDTFVQQIVDSAQAAIDKAAEMGVADPQRVAVGGHSYGAFMTANLLAHCDLFRAGIARSGAYNRTLTPFGFQSERRPFWEAREIYMNLSPFTYAHQIKAPLLLVHGENDNNPGTFPIQSQRMYQAIKGNGGTVRLVMLPYESHGYRARESVLHTQAEMIEWLNKYVRDGQSKPRP